MTLASSRGPWMMGEIRFTLYASRSASTPRSLRRAVVGERARMIHSNSNSFDTVSGSDLNLRRADTWEKVRRAQQEDGTMGRREAEEERQKAAALVQHKHGAGGKSYKRAFCS